jgi:hypothetical protein
MALSFHQVLCKIGQQVNNLKGGHKDNNTLLQDSLTAWNLKMVAASFFKRPAATHYSTQSHIAQENLHEDRCDNLTSCLLCLVKTRK